MKTNLPFFQLLLLMLFTLVSFQMSSQISLLPPEPTGGGSGFTEICSGLVFDGDPPFNSYDITIAWGGTANADNEFVLELSDDAGDFTNAVELARVADQNNASPKSFDINFSIPLDSRGEAFKFRARSTSPANGAESQNSFPIYYMDVITNLNISELGDGNPAGTICNPVSVDLQVDNIAAPETYQYQWYKSGSPIAGETSHNLTITQSGIYQAFIDYGGCTFNSNTDSNIATIQIGATGAGVGITTPSKTALCVGDTEILVIDTIDPSWSYQWYQDTNAIAGATSTSYTVDASVAGFEGDYSVEVSGNDICTEQSVPVTITNGGGFTVTRNNPPNVVLLPLQSETLNVSTTATSPTYQWYRNNTLVSGATSDTLAITEDGTYFAAVTSGGSCSLTLNSENTVAVVPSSFEIAIDHDVEFEACINTSTVLELAAIYAIAADGTASDVTTQVETSFTYEWQLNGTAISGNTSSNISLTNTLENGDYILSGTLGSDTISSNSLPVQLLTNETLAISSTSMVYCNSSDAITISTTSDLTGESFSWERDGVSVNTTDASFAITDSGTYRLVVDKDGCALISNELAIIPLDPFLIKLDIDGDEVVFPEGSSKTVTASGGTAYEWFDASNTLMSSTDQMTFAEEGIFTLVAVIDNCQITRQITVVYLDLFNVPNVITPNGDGANDQWVIPNSYSNKSDVNIIIYNEKGEELVNELSYANNWPESSMSFPKQNMVFYYVIKNATETLKQGTITVIR